MSGLKYEIQSRELKSYKHTFDYNFCQIIYTKYAMMSLSEFKKCLRDSRTIGEIGHISSFILHVKNKDQDEYRDCLGDYGLIHLLFHCLENPNNADIHGKYIHTLFKEDIKLT